MSMTRSEPGGASPDAGIIVGCRVALGLWFSCCTRDSSAVLAASEDEAKGSICPPHMAAGKRPGTMVMLGQDGLTSSDIRPIDAGWRCAGPFEPADGEEAV